MIIKCIKGPTDVDCCGVGVIVMAAFAAGVVVNHLNLGKPMGNIGCPGIMTPIPGAIIPGIGAINPTDGWEKRNHLIFFNNQNIFK